MNIEEARELMHKLNHGDDAGVGIAASITGWETKLTDVESPDGDLLEAGVEQSKRMWWPLGATGPASPCCDAPGDEHEPHCVMFGRGDDAHPWDA